MSEPLAWREVKLLVNHNARLPLSASLSVKSVGHSIITMLELALCEHAAPGPLGSCRALYELLASQRYLRCDVAVCEQHRVESSSL